jgi:hypothetical protein
MYFLLSRCLEYVFGKRLALASKECQIMLRRFHLSTVVMALPEGEF